MAHEEAYYCSSGCEVNLQSIDKRIWSHPEDHEHWNIKITPYMKGKEFP